ncbi:hypothetical protein [Ulvibacter litoralis]|uniref:Membrane protein involved in the export of O-antigen and teichoic acid n=1 Tax=Ulvibacter litoralis TaxID=227084 RepID=A0A1G7D8V6_9FLAO|nr:hypothetical protein [Ulvibacter litoralis]GHC44463.1 hypothetical protein GCM10008083_03760 [Ulvibacter litoralis]SDE47953.1 hypothetical protein SAMN05421855_101829 [Ulvibacter litoralis]
MIKRLLIVGAFTGIGHLTNILILKYLSINIPKETISIIGEIDSLVILIVSIISFGLQLSATRKIAILDDWKEEYYSTQSARFTLSLFLIVVGLSGFLITKNVLFLFSPIFGLNGDYALYARGKPKLGAFVSMLRVIIPAMALFLASIYWNEYLVTIYGLTILGAYILAGLIVSSSLQVDYFVKPNVKNLKKYWIHLGLGIASVLFLFIGISLINIVSLIYTTSIVAIIYLILKFYMIFKGIRQIIVQSFYKELIEEKIAFKVDQIASITGLVFFISLGFFLNVMAPVFFSEEFINYHSTFFLIGLAGFVSSFTTSTGARLLLLSKDKEYTRNIILAAGITIISSIVFYYVFGNKLSLIALSILIGELVLSGLNTFSVKENNFLIKRIKAILPFVLISLLFLLINYLYEESMITYITFLITIGASVIFFSKKKLTTTE